MDKVIRRFASSIASSHTEMAETIRRPERLPARSFVIAEAESSEMTPSMSQIQTCVSRSNG